MNHELNAQVAEKVMGERYLNRNIPDFSGSLDAAHKMEAELEMQGVQHEYMWKLKKVIADELGPNVRLTWWPIIRATPEQRCRAALEAVREK